jgi:putative hemolysin
VGIGGQIALVAVLLLINAMLAGSEVALISLRDAQLRALEERGGRGRAAAALARDPNRFLATVQIGITLSGFLASATAAVALAEPLVPLLSPLGGAAGPVSVLIVTAVLTLLTLVLGELAPKRIAMQRAEGWALMLGGPLATLARATSPFVWLLGHATDLVVRVAGADPSLGRTALTHEEIRDLIATGGLYDRDERRIIAGTLEATDRVVREVLRPRHLVVALRGDLPVEEGVRELVASGHSRAPVYRDRLDDADRVVTLIDLVTATGTVAGRARAARVLPDSMAVFDALRELQQARQSLAIVVDEYGGVVGIITVEDLVEELVGEIHDEADRDVREAVRNADGSVTLVGHFPVHDLVDVGVELEEDVLPEGDFVTVAGLVNEHLGRLPDGGETFALGAWEFRVDAVDGRTTARVTIRAVPGPVGDTGDASA